MGFRFRKSINLGKGVRINFNKKSAGISFGTKGARYSINSNGRRTASVGIPGTGLYYTKTSGGSSHKKTLKQNKKTDTSQQNNYNLPNTPNENVCKKCGTVNESNTKICSNCGAKLDTVSNTAIILWLIFFFPIGIYLMLKKSNMSKKTKTIIISAFVLLFILFIILGGSSEKSTNQLGIDKISISESSITTELEDITIYKGEMLQAEIHQHESDDIIKTNDFKFIVDKPDIATVTGMNVKTENGKTILEILIKGLKIGETEFYVETADGAAKSSSIKIYVVDNIKETTTELTTETTTETTTPTTITTTKKPSNNKSTKENNTSKKIPPQERLQPSQTKQGKQFT
ncbi:MAG: hypothetical protein DBY14_03165 [Escherichia coli]|nr:MAG: hypothetical protein DBY14_03165 [Escherichia coli]